MCSISFCNRSGSFFHEPSLNSMSPFGRNISKILFFGKLYSQLRFTEWGGVCLATFWHSMHFAGISAATRQERREAGKHDDDGTTPLYQALVSARHRRYHYHIHKNRPGNIFGRIRGSILRNTNRGKKKLGRIWPVRGFLAACERKSKSLF